MRAYEQALEELSFPQVEYTMVGGKFYGEPATATAIIGAVGAAGQLVGGLVGMSQSNKQREAEMKMQEQIAKDQMLINAQLAASEAQTSAQHAANMPLYLFGGIAGLGVLGLVFKSIAASKKG